MARSHWVRRTNMVDSRTSVTDVKFAPRQLGLQLATSSSDGVVRIYEAPDVMNLSTWTVQYEIQGKHPISCLTWNCSFSRLIYFLLFIVFFFIKIETNCFEKRLK